MLLAFGILLNTNCLAQTAPGTAGDRGRILLVLPFDNRTGQPSLEWIREASAEILTSRLASAGFAPMSRADRLYALDHLGLPQGFHPSRATSLKLAQTLDVDSIIVGSYVTDGTGIIAEAQIVDVPHLRMSLPVSARGEMRDLIPTLNALAWRLTRQLDPAFGLAEESFVAEGSGLRLDAFEQYIRGITEPDQAERLSHLNSAVVRSPEFSQAWMALGREEYASQHYEQAAVAFGKVGRNDSDALEASFFRGLSLIFSGDYARAEETFTAMARVLPIAEVLNNEGVAVTRRGKDAIPLFRQAVAADLTGADYRFNLALSLKRKGETAEALAELAQSLKLRPNDSEALAVQKAWTEPAVKHAAKPVPAALAPPAEDSQATEEVEAKVDPLEHIIRNFNAGAFRQAALVIDQMDEAKLAALPPGERAEKLAAHARSYLDNGLLLEAERLFQEAVAIDASSAAAHAGLAEVRERTGDAQAARKEATTSLELLPSVDAYMVMGRLNLASGHLDWAMQNADAALKIDPASKAVLDLKRKIETSMGQMK